MLRHIPERGMDRRGEASLISNTPGAGPIGIGGWLLLPAIFLIVQPVALALQAIEIKEYLADPSTTMIYWPAVVVNILLGGWSIVLLRQFIKKQAAFPSRYLVFLIAGFATWTITAFLLPVDPFAPQGLLILGAVQPGIRELLIGLVWTSVFTPYLIYSKRVKNTFSNGTDLGENTGLIPRLRRRPLVWAIVIPGAMTLMLVVTITVSSIAD
jgi:hypothetical protein